MPASPRVPEDHDINGAGSIVAGTLLGIGGDDAAAPLSGNLVAAATDLAGSLLQAAEATEATDSKEERREEGQEDVGKGDHPRGTTETATDVVVRSPTPSLDPGHKDETSDSPAVDSDYPVAAAAVVEHRGGEAERRRGSSALFPTPAKLEEPAPDEFPAMMNGHGGRLEDREGGDGSALRKKDVTPLDPRSVSLPAGSGGDNNRESGEPQPQQRGEDASNEPQLLDRGEAETPSPPNHGDTSSIERSIDARGEALQAPRPDNSDGRKNANIGSSPQHSGMEEGEGEEGAPYEEGARSAARGSDDQSSQQAHGSADDLRGADASTPTTTGVASKTTTEMESHHRDRGERADPEYAFSSHGREVDKNADRGPSGSTRHAVSGGTAATPKTAEAHIIPSDDATARPSLSREETENAMAALIAKLRQPSADPPPPHVDPPRGNASDAPPDDAPAGGLAADRETEGRHSLEANSGAPATESREENTCALPSGALEQAAETNGPGIEEGKGAADEALEGKASEAAEGMYEDDFDDD